MGEILLEQLSLAKFALEIKHGPQNESLDEYNYSSLCSPQLSLSPGWLSHLYLFISFNTSRVLLALLIPWGQIVSLGARLSLLGLCETTL